MKAFQKNLALVLAALLVVLGASAALAAEGAKPAFKQFHTIVDLAFVKNVVHGKTKAVLIDARPAKKKYDKGHIPGALSIPFSSFDKKVNLLPKDKSTTIVYYCGGLKCPLSHKSAFKAEKLGYKNVKVFALGYPAWVKAYGPGPTAQADAVARKLKDAGYKPYHAIVSIPLVKKVVDGQVLGLLVDSRPKKTKYDKGHIPGALSIPTSKFDKMKGLLPADKNLLLVFYCGGLKCALSHKAAYKAEKLGYTKVRVFAEGYPVWKKAFGAGAALAAAPAQAKAPARQGSLKPGKEEGSVDLDLFRKIAAEKGKGVYLVDVRDPHEFKAGSISGSVNIPVDKLEKSLDRLPKDKPIIFVCGTGARAGEAYYMLKDLRPEMKDVYYLDAEVTFNQDGSCNVKKPH